VDTAADEAAINAVREHEAALAGMGNADSMAVVYTDDVSFMPPGEPAVEGIAGVKAWATKAFATGTLTVKYSSSQVTVRGDQAVDRYTGSLTFTPMGGGAGMTEQLKGVHVMRKGADGSWKIAVDVWNTDAPTPPPPPAPKP
jgi:uncharacterized protein (TIGR02246 family)